MKEIWIFDRLPAKFCGMVEEYRLELAKKSWIDLQLYVSLSWITICWIHETVLISKKFWFIKWLVDNDKIDLLKLTCMNPRYTEILDSDFSWEDRIIMLLSIQDNPIEFFISILK